MKFKKVRSILIPFVTFFTILTVSAGIIAYSRGYRLDFTKKTLNPTGLLSLTSDPVGAQVYINEELKTATNNPVAVGPGWHKVKIAKEGYMDWEKSVRVQGEVVTRADAFLFPTNPSLSPLTTLGIENPVLSPDGTRIAYAVPILADSKDTLRSKKAGLWVYELADRPLGRNRDPQQLAQSDNLFNFATSLIIWSPDSTEILADNTKTQRLYQVNKSNTYSDVTMTKTALFLQWSDERQTKERAKLTAFPQEIINLATTSAKIISFSPDETKLLYEATRSATLARVIDPSLIGTNSTEEERSIQPGKLYVYDIKEDKNYFLLDKKELPMLKPTPTPTKKNKAATTSYELPAMSYQLPIFWFPTSRHFVLLLPDKVDVMEYDRTNWITVYSGPFVDGFLAPWPTGSRLIVMTNLNPTTQSHPNLYTINLR